MVFTSRIGRVVLSWFRPVVLTRLLVMLILTSAFIRTWGQSAPAIFNYEDFLGVLRKNHPVMYQADLLGSLAAAEVDQARGGFDPKVEMDYRSKSFDDKNYYQILDGALKVPTWFGIDLKAGYSYNRGEFLNASEFLPAPGLWDLGLSVPLGKGLLLDDRRAQLQKAKLFVQSAEQERMMMVNDLLFDALQSYLEWQQTYQNLEIAREGVTLAEQRLNGTVASFEQGDKPAVDTLESFLSLQSRRQSLVKARQEYLNAGVTLSQYLWLDGQVPLELDSLTIPGPLQSILFEEFYDGILLREREMVDQHPLVNQYNLKIDQLEIDMRLNREAFKPDIRLDYFPLVPAGDRFINSFVADNYKFGATLNYPILQRKARGKLRANEIKSQDLLYDLSLKRRDLEIKLRLYRENVEIQENQLELVNEMVENYRRLLDAEYRRFEVGESSVFLVNSREVSYIESRKKQIEILAQLTKYRLAYLYFGAVIMDVQG